MKVAFAQAQQRSLKALPSQSFLYLQAASAWADTRWPPLRLPVTVKSQVLQHVSVSSAAMPYQFLQCLLRLYITLPGGDSASLFSFAAQPS